jgi:hypothetical protein
MGHPKQFILHCCHLILVCWLSLSLIFAHFGAIFFSRSWFVTHIVKELGIYQFYQGTSYLNPSRLFPELLTPVSRFS